MKILFILFFCLTLIFSTEVSYSNGKKQYLSEYETRELIEKLEQTNSPYKILKDSQENLFIEVSASSYAVGYEAGTIFREVVDKSYDTGFSFGKWLRKLFY